MNISLSFLLTDTHPQLKFGIIQYDDIVISESPQMIKGRVQLYQENLFFEMQEAPLSEIAGIKEWRQLWKSLGADSNRYRPSVERLYRRIAKQDYLQPTQSAIDLNNFFSLQYEIPIGLYDTTKLNGDIAIDLGDSETGYDGLNGRYISLQNILYSKDAAGPFGSPYVDSLRTAVNEETTYAIQLFYLRPSLGDEECVKLLNAAGKMFCQVNGGEFKVALLTSDQPVGSL